MIYVHYVPQLDAADRLSRALRVVAGIESTSSHRCASGGRCSRVKVRDVIRVLEAHGWHLERQRGSHRIFRHETRGGTVTVAGRPNTDIPPGSWDLSGVNRD